MASELITEDRTRHSAEKSVGIIRHLNLGTAVIVGALLAVTVNRIATKLIFEGDETWRRHDQIVMATMLAWFIGFMIGIGALVGPTRWFFGKDLNHDEAMFLAGKDMGLKRYFRYTTDHKVVGIQYLILTITLFFIGGVLAMLIRTNLGHESGGLIPPQVYNSIVGFHGLIMIIATIIMITGPFGNFILPIMIGARDMAFPRLNALSFWLLISILPILAATIALGGIPMGWSGYNPLADQGPLGVDSYIFTIVIFAISSAVAGANITTTAMKMRARGMNWSRTPLFVFGTVASVALALPAFPVFMLSQVMSAMDRAFGANFFNPEFGGSAWLYENLFWIMGHPEVYVILIPAVVAIMEITPVFARKPLFSFNMAIVGIFGIVGLSIFVWAHHMYISGWAPLLNGPFMLTTELISIPTGLLFLVILGTIWRGSVWTRLPMLSVYALLFNFIIGGVTGIFLSDVPEDAALHGSMFVTAHFHYTLMGAGLTGALGALAYWFPKMTGRMLDEKLGRISFWLVQIGFTVTFFGMFAVGLEGQPRRVEAYDIIFKNGNLISTMGAYTIFIGMLILLAAVITSWRNGEIAGSNPWGAQTLEWMTPTPVPLENFEVLPVVTTNPYQYGIKQETSS